ncbi:MAG: hypothetical protein ACK4UJ_02240 [Leptonema sp. (in: bacteria)]
MKAIRFLPFLVWIGFWSISPQAKKLPLYEEGEKILEKLVEEVLYLQKEDFSIERLQTNRILRKWDKNQFVYYYRYKISIPIYERDGEKLKKVSERKEEVWLRIPHDFSFIQLSFLRVDLLPGTNLVWIE